MKPKYTCFVDFGLEHVALLIANIENNQLIDVPLILHDKINIPKLYRPKNSIEQTENFKVLLKLITEAEKRLKTYIFDIIFVIKSKAICSFLIENKIDFKRRQKISQSNKEELATRAIRTFNEQTNCYYNILDVIYNNFVLDEHTIVKNPYKIPCNSLSLNATIVGIKKKFSANISESLEKLKLHIKHYISPCVAIGDILKDSFIKNNIFLLIDIGSSATEYCIVQNNCITYLNTINLGGIDMTRDIATEMNIHIDDADILKKNVSNEEIEDTENNKIENIANARLEEISNLILKTIKKNVKNVFFEKIYIFGNVSMYKNIKDIIGNIFKSDVEILTIKHLDEKILNGKIKEKDLKFENLQLFSALFFYINNLNMHENARHGFLFKIPSKISCFLKDILY